MMHRQYSKPVNDNLIRLFKTLNDPDILEPLLNLSPSEILKKTELGIKFFNFEMGKEENYF